MARPKGVPNKDKPFKQALMMEIAAAGEDLSELRAIARVLLKQAKNGDMHAIAMLADRTDGKAVQGIGQDSELGPVIVRWLDQEQASEPIDIQPTDSQPIDTKH